jgi:HAD superfamily hydrolase (TIGR01509 family)
LRRGYWEKSFGRKNAEIISEILGWNLELPEIIKLAARKEALYREVVRERAVKPLAGVREWLSALAAAGIPCGIASSTVRANIDLSLGLIGAAPFFQTIVSAEAVTQGKPEPEVFLTVAERLGARPERCIVFEDSLPGLEAARRAGMVRVGVAITHPAELIAPHADFVVRLLDELSVTELAAAVAAPIGTGTGRIV